MICSGPAAANLKLVLRLPDNSLDSIQDSKGRSNILSLTILIVEEDSSLRERWVERLRRSGHRTFAFADGRGALEAAQSHSFDFAVLSFLNPKDLSDLQSFLKSKNPHCQVTLTTERPQDERDALALESGARSILVKPVAEGALEEMVERAARSRGRRTAKLVENGGVEAILGDCAEIKAVKDLIRKVAASTDTSVLVTGESGTGKELAARAVHGMSARAGEPFLEINCAAIPEPLLESELFGHEKGAFTDARQMKPGLFELADGGTLFLDEVGEISLRLQAKLLRMIDTKSVRRIAGQETRKLDVRIVAATNRDLPSEVRGNRFRSDLFHRLNVVEIRLPPLRDRKEDVGLLARHFLGQMARKFGKPGLQFEDGVMEILETYGWPGNVRELMNQVERAVLMCQGAILGIGDFPLIPRAESAPGELRGPQRLVQVDFRNGPVRLEEVEREVIAQALEAANWNISEAARLLQVGRGALRYKIERFRLERRALAG